MRYRGNARRTAIARPGKLHHRSVSQEKRDTFDSLKLTVGQCVVSDVVTRRVGEDPENRGNIRRVVRISRILSSDSPLHADCPRDVHAQERDGASEIHLATLEFGDKKRDKSTANQLPARVGQIDLLLENRIVLADHG